MNFLMFFMLFNYALSASPSKSKIDLSKSVVKIFIQSSVYDYREPWSSPSQSSGNGSGFIVEGRRIITCAHMVSNASFIQIRKAGHHKKYIAKVKRIFHSIDLAILEVLDEEFFSDTVPLEVGDIPKVGQDVTLFGFPVGGEEMSVTKGIISRIELMRSSHSGAKVLVCDMDAAITFGNSGGPAISNDKVVGVAFQAVKTKEGGYIVTGESIKNILIMDDKGKQYSVPDIGLDTQSLENDNLKKSMKIPKESQGVLVISVADFSNLKGIVQKYDILLKLDSFDIANNGTVEIRKSERVSYEYAISRKSLGDSLKITFMRDGTVMEKDITLTKTSNDIRYAAEFEYDTPPAFLIKGGLIFQPLVRNTFQFTMLSADIHALLDSFRTIEQPDIVELNCILQSDLTEGYSFSGAIVEKINDRCVFTLSDVEEAFKIKVEFHKVELCNGELVIIPSADLEQKTSEIMKNYGIVKSFSGFKI